MSKYEEKFEIRNYLSRRIRQQTEKTEKFVIPFSINVCILRTEL